MPNKEKEKIYPIIEEVEDEPTITDANDSDIEEIDFSELPQRSTTQTETREESYALAIHDEKMAKQNLTFSHILKQQRKTNDHSSSAYGDQFVPTFGSVQFAPSAPDMTEEDVFEYEEWLRATSLIERSRFPQHDRWQETLRTDGGTNLGFNPVLTLAELDQDKISNDFKSKVVNGLNSAYQVNDDINAFLGRQAKPKNYRDLPKLHLC